MRWQAFEPREGDIFICTPSKSGTTWMQAMVAHLIFGGTPPKPVNEISPWFDMEKVPLEETLELLRDQTHRRFIKTHTPFDGLPRYEGATYIHVSRHPVDVMFSMINHMENMKDDLPDRDKIEDLAFLFDRWVERTVEDWATGAGLAMGYVFHHVETFFAARQMPNLHLFHYATLKRDTETEMRRLARALAIEVPETAWDDILSGVSLKNMKANAKAFAPGVRTNTWKDPARFFDKGRQGMAEEGLSAEQLSRYREKVSRIATPELLDWVEEGRAPKSP